MRAEQVQGWLQGGRGDGPIISDPCPPPSPPRGSSAADWLADPLITRSPLPAVPLPPSLLPPLTFRVMESGEYIQMSGRAGRRGKDDRGLCIFMVDQDMEEASCRYELHVQE